MRHPRFSIGGLMVLIVLIALDCLAVRIAWDSNDIRVVLLFFGVLPWLNVLGLGLSILAKKRRRWEPLAFLVGFQVVGWILFLLDVAFILAYPDEWDVLLQRWTTPLNPLTEVMFPAGLVLAMGIVMAVTTLPQLALAYVGGLLNRRYRLRIERREPVPSPP